MPGPSERRLFLARSLESKGFLREALKEFESCLSSACGPGGTGKDSPEAEDSAQETRRHVTRDGPGPSGRSALD
jgi:hypothetical protein